jgi:hypothetical protein
MRNKATIILSLFCLIAGQACSSPDGSGTDGLPEMDIPTAEDRHLADQGSETQDFAAADQPDSAGQPELPIQDSGDGGAFQDLLDIQMLDLSEDVGTDSWVETLSEDIPPDLYVPPCFDGDKCDDKEQCTFDDTCVGTTCGGVAYGCDDGRACTLDTCDGLGNCDYTLMVGRCLINGICAKAGENKPGNLCIFCNPGYNPFVWSEDPFAPCDDGNACTLDDQCEDGICSGIDAFCNDDNPCTIDICDPTDGCTYPSANVPCDDGDPCTGGDFCEDGVCLGGPAPGCDDQNSCTLDFCQQGKGCFHSLLEDMPCDDNDACTVGDMCIEGQCVSGTGTVTCNDFNDCTADICQPLAGCTYPLNGNPCCINDINICDDKDPCTIDDCNLDTGACLYLPNEGECTDKDACTEDDVCTGGVCQGVAVDCEDNNPCTDDFCLEAVGCIHSPINAECDDGSVCTLNDWCSEGICTGTKVNCNDYNFCTDDICDPDEGCQNLLNEAACNDYDLCTGEDHCEAGQCVGTAKTCDDGNACTDDFCDPAVGCQNLFNVNPCDDGDECTVGDACQGGQCVPGETICVSCNYDFSDAVNRATSMQIATDSAAGNALDLNDDGELDNSMAGIGGLANGPLQESLDKGDIHLLLEHHGIKTNGSIYTVAMFIGDLAGGYEQCDFVNAYCGYVAKSDTVDPDSCQAMVAFDNASIFQGKLVAGGPSYTFPWQIPLSEDTLLNIILYSARIEADVTTQQGIVTAIDGVIGGAIPKESFLAAIDSLPEEGLPLPKDMIKQMIQALIINDIDTDGNGLPDAASIAIKFEGIASGIVGLD